MAVLPVFGKVKFERALKAHPTLKPNPNQQIANITIPHTRSKNYDDPRLRKEIMNVVKSYGFTEGEFILALKGKKLKK